MSGESFMKKKVYEITLKEEEYKSIKSNRKLINLQLGTDEIKNIQTKDKIKFVCDEKKKKAFKRKVKKLHIYSNLEEIENGVKRSKLGLKKNEKLDSDTFSKSDIKKYGVVGIEVKPKVTLMKILLIILCIILACMLLSRVDKFLKRLNVEKVGKQINEVYEEKSGYVFLEINPSMVLSTKGSKVVGVSCINDDCRKMKDDIDVEGMSVTESIENIYNIAGSKGFDTSKGVKVKSSESVKIDKELDYVTIEYIPKEEEKTLLADVRDDDSLKVNDNDDYYTTLWNELKKDSRYDEAYTCSMVGERLECHFLEDFIRPIDALIDESSPVTNALQILFFNQITGIKDTLDKFGIENTFGQYAANMGDDTNQIILNGVKYQYVLDYNYNGLGIRSACYYRAKVQKECDQELGLCTYWFIEKAFALVDMDLLNPAAVLGKLKVDSTN